MELLELLELEDAEEDALLEPALLGGILNGEVPKLITFVKMKNSGLFLFLTLRCCLYLSANLIERRPRLKQSAKEKINSAWLP